jgi:hypothetical protein
MVAAVLEFHSMGRLLRTKPWQGIVAKSKRRSAHRTKVLTMLLLPLYKYVVFVGIKFETISRFLERSRRHIVFSI